MHTTMRPHQALTRFIIATLVVVAVGIPASVHATPEPSGLVPDPEQITARFRERFDELLAIANEAEIDAEYIGRIEIHEDYSTVDLPEGMPKEIFKHLKSVWVSGVFTAATVSHPMASVEVRTASSVV